jgi:hypothetical protein
MEETTIKTDFSLAECKMMLKILNSENDKRMTMTKLSKLINVSIFNPSYCEVKKYLLDNNILEVIERIGSTKIIKINYKKLRDLIDEQQIVNTFYDYL